MKKPDLIGVIEAIYSDAPDDQAWLEGIAAAAEPALDHGFGTMAYTFKFEPPAPPKILETVALGRYGARLLKAASAMVAEQGVNAGLAFQSQVSVLSTVTGRTVADPEFMQRHFRAVGGVGGAKDVLGVIGADASGVGTLLTALTPAGWEPKPAFRRQWRCIVSHLATGRRLRTQGSVSDEATLDAGGKIYDAVGKARSREARVALRQAARTIDRARAQRLRAPDAALTAWQALVEARWSLVDRFESDGRTYLIAKPNPPRPPNVNPLTERELAVAALAALGRGNKQIAYELGLSLGSVGTYLLRAQRRLRLNSRSELIREFHRIVRTASPR